MIEKQLVLNALLVLKRSFLDAVNAESSERGMVASVDLKVLRSYNGESLY
jgi:hypothetical protein